MRVTFSTIILILALAPTAHAVDRGWVGSSGNWLDAARWNPFGAPQAGDRLFITAADTLERTATYNDNGPLKLYNSIVIDQGGTGLFTLSQAANSLNSTNLAVGQIGRGSYVMSGGTGTFPVASVGGQGLLRVSGSSSFNAGSFTPRGTVDVLGAATFSVENYAQLDGQLAVSGGATFSAGNFTQGGDGVSAAGRTLRVTNNYAFNAGTFNGTPVGGGSVTGGVACATFDYNAAGSFGGTVEVTQRLNVNAASALIGGDLLDRAPALEIASNRSLAVRQVATKIGGNVTQAGTFSTPGSGIVGVSPGTLRVTGGARWTQTGGINAGGDLIVGAGEGGAGTYTINNGTVNYAGGGFIVLGHLSDGTFIQNGGTVTTLALVVGGAPTTSLGAQRGAYVKTGGALNTGSFGIIFIGRDPSAGGAFTQSGGTTVCRDLVINENATNHAVLTLTGGSLTVAGRTINHGTFNQSGGVSTLAGHFDGAGTASVSGNAVMNAHRIRQNALHIGGDAGIHPTGDSFTPPTHRVLALTFEDGPGGAVRGTWNLGASDLVVDYAGASPLNNLKRYLTSGYAGGSWNGTGLQSSAAFAQNRALGFAESSDVLGPAGGTFSGVFADATAVLVKYTRYGDANLDGLVNLADFNRLAANFGQSNRVWSQGDFNYDGTINLFDFNRLAANFGLSAAGPEVTPQDWSNLAAAVPEPAAPAIVAIALAGAVTSRRRRR